MLKSHTPRTLCLIGTSGPESYLSDSLISLPPSLSILLSLAPSVYYSLSLSVCLYLSLSYHFFLPLSITLCLSLTLSFSRYLILSFSFSIALLLFTIPLFLCQDEFGKGTTPVDGIALLATTIKHFAVKKAKVCTY